MSKNDYVISLKKAYDNKPRKRRANYAIRIIYDFLRKHTRKERDQIVISDEVNNFVWSNSIQRPPRKVYVSLKYKDDFVHVFLKDSKQAQNFGKEEPSKKTAKEKLKAKLENKEEKTTKEKKTEKTKTQPIVSKEEKHVEKKTEEKPVVEKVVEEKKEIKEEPKEEIKEEIKK